MRIATFLLMLLCLVNSACSSAPPVRKGTGARETAMKYLDALVKQDWDTAYVQLHADTRNTMDRPAFERRASAYCKQLGFPLGAYFVRTSDEQGKQATVHVTLSDANNSVKNHYREGLVLQSSDNGWAIVLPANFGKR